MAFITFLVKYTLYLNTAIKFLENYWSDILQFFKLINFTRAKIRGNFKLYQLNFLEHSKCKKQVKKLAFSFKLSSFCQKNIFQLTISISSTECNIFYSTFKFVSDICWGEEIRPHRLENHGVYLYMHKTYLSGFLHKKFICIHNIK